MTNTNTIHGGGKGKMKATKTPAGNWNVRVPLGEVDGKRKWKSITAKTKKEAELAAALFAAQNSGQKSEIRETVYELTLKYCDAKSSILSPSTIRTYRNIAETRIKGTKFGAQKAAFVTQGMVQKWISDFSRDVAPKTVRNIYGLLKAVYALYLPDKTFKITLPRKSVPQLHTPEYDEIKAVLDIFTARGDMDMIRAILLASCCSLRRGEICALDASDFDFSEGTAFISKSLVIDGKNWSVKAPKTETSRRLVPIPANVLQYIPRSGKVVDLTPAAITDRWRRAI
ncbi:MAG: hypothetical protein MJZ76_06430 [Bacteroidales bacterium]|nr:hypothetical protein [Bacteroidales bacterium]